MEIRGKYLLKNEEKMIVYTDEYAPCGAGHIPENRPIHEYLKYGVVVLDKTSGPSSHEVVTWVKTTLECEKTGHSGTLDPTVTGVLPICLNKATKLAKSQQTLGKTYICEIRFHNLTLKEDFVKACNKLKGHLFQRPPEACAVKRELRLRWIHDIKILEFEGMRALFEVKCEAGTYIRTLCVHIGYFTKTGATMESLRRIRSGLIDESSCVTLHDLKDSYFHYKKTGEEEYLRRVILPVESFLEGHLRVMIKDTAVASICHGGQLTIKGLYKYDKGIVTGSTVAVITVKGELVALGKSMVEGSQLGTTIKGVIVKTIRVVMEKDLYPKIWGIMTNYEVYGEDGECLLKKN